MTAANEPASTPALDDPSHPDNYTDEDYFATYTEPGTEGACAPIPVEVIAQIESDLDAAADESGRGLDG